jgi:septum formation protein
MTLILASASASRRTMLEDAGVAHEVIVSAVDEGAIKEKLQRDGEDARAIALALATAKTLAVSVTHPGRWVLGGDSIVSAGGRFFDKPVSREDAAEHLRFFSGKMMTLDSSAVLARDGAAIDWASDDAHLEVRALSDAFIDRYLDAEWPAISGCVGCFRIEGRGVHLFEVITGSHFTVLGMPLLPVLGFLREHKVMEG